MNAPEQAFAPQSIESEQSVLGALLLDNDAVDRMGDMRAAHFYRHDHRLIFETIVTLIVANKPADVITVYDVLTAKGHAEKAGGLPYLNSLAKNTPSARNIGRYAHNVRDKALMRGLMAASSRVNDLVTEPNGLSAVEMLDAAQAEIGKLADQTSLREPASIQDAMVRYIEDLDARFHGEKVNPGIATGLSAVDELLNGGVRRGALCTIGARPGMGKSALAETIGCNAADAGHSVLFLSMEMPEAEVVERAIANWGRVSSTALAAADARLTDDSWARITHAVNKASTASFFIDDQPALTLLEVVTKARTIKRKHGLDLLVVDYLQLMSGSEEKRYQQIEAITKGLKTLAKTLNIAVIALSQFSRDIEKRPNPRPKSSDFRDSGSIEQDSDILMGLYREEQDNPDTQWKGMAELFLMKNRQGKTGKACIAYLGEFMRFENFSGPIPEAEASRPARRGLRD